MGLWSMITGGARADAGPENPGARDPSDDAWYGLGGRRSEIDVQVTIERARQIPVVRDCLQVRSESVAGLGIGIFEMAANGDTLRRDDHPVLSVLEDPNPRQTSFEFINSLVDDLDTDGNFYAEMIFENGRLTELWRLEPELVQLEELPDRSKRFRYTDYFGRTRVLLEGEVWHIAMPPLIENLRGRSAILDDGREAVAVAIALQRYANILFANDATPNFLLVFPEGQFFKDGESKKNFLRGWRKWSGGKKRHTPGVLEHGMKPHKVGLSSEEAQFLETRKELWLDLTRLWRVQPHKVGILDRATFSNIEEQSLEFVTDTLTPILELIERSVNKFLIGDRRFRFEFNVSTLLRGDIKARFEAYALGRQWGWMSVNDILRMEKRNGIGAAGDRYIEPLNMVPVGIADRERPAKGSTAAAIHFLRQGVAGSGGKPRLELIKDAA
jgi:HK97 family phage portal protein